MSAALQVDAVLLLVCVVLALYCLSTRGHDYWRKRGVPGPDTVPFFGTHKDLLLGRKAGPNFFKDLYDHYVGDPVVGMVQIFRPAILIRDTNLIKLVCTKDFNHFMDRGVPVNEKMNPLSAHLFALEGARWRNLRTKLTPTFTSGKIKTMLPLMLECSTELQRLLDVLAGKEEVVEFKDIMSRFTIDIIGSCAFGVNCNSLRDPNAEFRRFSMQVFNVTLWTRIRQAIVMLSPRLAGLVPVRAEATKFFLDTVRKTVEFREENRIMRTDFMNLMIDLRKTGKIGKDDSESKIGSSFTDTSAQDVELTDDVMAAQAFVFFVAGFETSSTTLSFCLLELAHNLHIQNALRKEIDEIIDKHCGVTYEAIMEMEYLDKVLSETLRKYPPVTTLIRRTTKPYHIPDSKIMLEVGTRVYIPTYALHHDAEYYPHPEQFDPERFSREAKAARNPYTYLPFGEGPRMCIARRFGLMQTKVGLVAVLSRYEAHPTSLTKLPVEMRPGSIVTTSKGGCHLRLLRRRTTVADGNDVTQTRPMAKA